MTGYVQSPVLKCAQPDGHTLYSPLAVGVWVEDKLDEGVDKQLCLQGEKMILPWTATLLQDNHLSTGVNL